MNILATIDKNYLMPLINMLVSIGESNKDTDIDFYVAHSSLTEEEIEKIKDAAVPYSINVIPIMVDGSVFDDMPIDERLSKETFYRLLAFKFLPESVERILYLDPDIIVLRSLKPLYEMDMGDNIIAASSHTYSYIEKLNHVRLSMGKHSKYINAGIMLMNIKEMRDFTSVEDISEYIKNNIQKLYLADQDVANGMFWSKTMDIDEKLYNMDEKTLKRYKLDIDFVKKETVIVHYNGKYKPWLEGYKGELDVLYPPVENKGPAPEGKLANRIKFILKLSRLNTQQRVVLTLALIFWLSCIFCYVKFGSGLWDIVKDPVNFKTWLSSFGGHDRILFVAVRALQTVVKIIPAEPLEIGSGYAYGTFMGLVYCLLGSVIGSVVILVMTKLLGKKIVEIFVPAGSIQNIRLFKDEKKVNLLVFILYLIPGTPKDVFTYLVGLTPINPVPFLIISSFARIPSIVSSTWCGATLSDKNYLFAAAIFIATLLLGLLGGYIYGRISDRKK